LDVDHITDRLHFVAASIPAGWGVTVESAAALLLEQQQAGQRMADLIHRILNDTTSVADHELADAINAWDAL
jgi:hypothetical protein